MSDLVGNPEDRFSRVAAPLCLGILILSAQDENFMLRVCAMYTPLNPNFYKEKIGFAGDIPNFLIFDPKHTLWVHVLVRTCTHNVCFEGKH